MRLPITTSLMVAAVLAAPGAAHAQGGGANPDRPSDTGGAAWEAPPTAALTPGGVRGGSMKWLGTVPTGAGSVRIERLDEATATWTQIAQATADDSGAFVATWAADRTPTGDYTVRAVPEGSSSAEPVVQRVTVFRGAKATWYGPGFYGHRLACGGRLTKSTLGVAHKTLPCGTQVQVWYRGRALTVPVVDRGPFANGASYDLTAATAQALGMQEPTPIGVVTRGVGTVAHKKQQTARG